MHIHLFVQKKNYCWWWTFNVINDISELVGIITSAIGAGNTDSLPGITTGMRLEQDKCRRDVTKIWKAVCYDITRGGNTKVIGVGKSYFDANGNRLSNILVDPDEYEQSVIALEYSKDIARRVINNVRDGSYTIGTAFNITAGQYSATSGIITVTTNVGHGLTDKDTVKLAGLGFSCAAHNNVISITDFEYDSASGFSTITVASDHGLSSGDEFELFGATFTCSSGSSVYPDGTNDYIFDAYVGTAGTVIYTNVGISTIDHTYDSGGEVRVGVTTTVFPDGTFGDCLKSRIMSRYSSSNQCWYVNYCSYLSKWRYYSKDKNFQARYRSD